MHAHLQILKGSGKRRQSTRESLGSSRASPLLLCRRRQQRGEKGPPILAPPRLEALPQRLQDELHVRRLRPEARGAALQAQDGWG